MLDPDDVSFCADVIETMMKKAARFDVLTPHRRQIFETAIREFRTAPTNLLSERAIVVAYVVLGSYLRDAHLYELTADQIEDIRSTRTLLTVAKLAARARHVN